VFLLAFALAGIVSIVNHSVRPQEPIHQPVHPSSERRLIANWAPNPERPFDYVIEEEVLARNGYVFKRQTRKTREFIDEPRRPHNLEFDIAYAAAFRSGKRIKKFDAIPSNPKTSVSFGVFPFLGQSSEEVLISQDTFRGGCQWVVALSSKFRVIFDGKQFGVGREGADGKVPTCVPLILMAIKSKRLLFH
jgi:hypothetical protein